MKSLTLLLVAIQCSMATQYVTLIGPENGDPSNTLTLAEGQIAEVVDFNGANITVPDGSTVHYDMGQGLNLNIIKDGVTFYTNGNPNSLLIAGPATIVAYRTSGQVLTPSSLNNTIAVAYYQGATMTTFKIESFGDSSGSSGTPADTSAILDVYYSTDLTTWDLMESIEVENPPEGQMFMKTELTPPSE